MFQTVITVFIYRKMMDTGLWLESQVMDMGVHEQIVQGCIQKFQTMLVGFKQTWWIQKHLHLHWTSPAMVTGVHWGNAYLQLECAMDLWNAVMAVMKKTVGDVFMCVCVKKGFIFMASTLSFSIYRNSI